MYIFERFFRRILFICVPLYIYGANAYNRIELILL